jgi:uncharacterized membrane protein YdjX (TVP38/TMEM64 family)
LVDNRAATKKIALGAVVVLALVAAYWGLWQTGALSTLTNKQALREWINQLGAWGPLAIITLMVAAIVVSPIPSGPIAMAAGAAYGPIWGAAWVVVGAEAGAIIAFSLARHLGYDIVRRWARVRPLLSRLEQHRSQTWLMAIVLVSRLIPFLSFDAVSYAAGLTPLAFWRFAVATLAGVVPIAFLFTYSGEVLISVGSVDATMLLLFLSSITLVPIALKLLWNWYRRRRDTSTGR